MNEWIKKLWYTETYMHTGEYYSIIKKKWKRAICNSVDRPQGFPGGSDSKESSCNAGDLGSPPGLGRSSGDGNGNPLQYSCLGNSMDKRSLAGYSPWGSQRGGHDWVTSFHFSLSSYKIDNNKPRFCLTWCKYSPHNKKTHGCFLPKVDVNPFLPLSVIFTPLPAEAQSPVKIL